MFGGFGKKHYLCTRKQETFAEVFEMMAHQNPMKAWGARNVKKNLFNKKKGQKMKIKNNAHRVSATEIINGIAQIASCRYGYGLISRSEVKLQKPKDTKAEFLARFGYEMPEHYKVTCVTNAKAYGYEKGVNNSLAKNNLPKDFKAGERKGWEWIVYPLIEQNTKGDLYLALSYKEGDHTTFRSRHIMVTDGVERWATPAEEDFLKSKTYQRPQKIADTQSAAGITKKEDEVGQCRYGFAKMRFIGDSEFINAIWEEED